jgi:hypothetical protein
MLDTWQSKAIGLAQFQQWGPIAVEWCADLVPLRRTQPTTAFPVGDVSAVRSAEEFA